ncbi:tetratricopeptide repeat protein [Pseudanabaena sp. ABRG5-3]|uniref:tetratricopeptide repeat protein n=1 Tax=Pseudanabaena sp. ABRG5-3 TaxID=685565 RepID=UPI000DC726FA|nr:tetratricopeptide repeat protein [Pseudanabaena sp. ABRG5-3]BBC24087.1 tetratricopeptide TPR_1 repeat-containing protein [Pseudanabaena sp. ABRG5-3]
MASQDLHLPHKQEEKLINEVAESIAKPDHSPVMFNIWGIGGVGKSTLLRKFQEGLSDRIQGKQIHFATITFDDNYATPLDVMVALHKDLPEISFLKRDVLAKDVFSEKYKTYKETLANLNNAPVKGKEKVERDQLDRVKQLTKLVANAGIWAGKTAASGGVSNPMTEFAASVTTSAVGSVLDLTIDGAASALSLKDKLMDELLLKHEATKDAEVRELMLDPLPKLTQAFVESLVNHAHKTPVVLVLDTYEKASVDFDTWLRQIFLKNKALKNSQLRVVTAGRYQLLKREGWSDLITGERLVQELPLREFEKDKVKNYLEKIGITDKREIEKFYKKTNGLPFHLHLIAQQKEQGIAIDSDEAIEKRLLVGLNEIQKKLVRYAACCRWFDRTAITSLANWQELDFAKGVDTGLNCFDWLKERDFVEFTGSNGRYRLGDVARDIIHFSLEPNERKEIHAHLQQYFEDLADQEVPPECWDGEKYENSVWCTYTAEAMYHAFFNLRRDGWQVYFLKHFFASRYFDQFEVMDTPAFAALASDAEFDDNHLLPQENKKFLESVKLLLPVGWLLVNSPPHTEVEIDEVSLPKALLERIENAIKKSLEKVDALPDGLSKCIALICKCLRAHRTRVFDIAKQAEAQAHLLEPKIEAIYRSQLFLEVGNLFNSLEQYEEAITDFDKAIELNPNYVKAWFNRGIAKGNLKRHKEAIADFDKVIELNPNHAKGWVNRGTAKGNLQRYEESISDYDKAIQINPNYAEAWSFQGGMKENLQRYEEAIADYDKAIELNPNYAQAWSFRGDAKENLQRYEEAIADHDKAIELNPNYAQAWSKRGIALTRLGKYDQALEHFNHAMYLDPNEIQFQINRGVLFAWMGRYDEAIWQCEQVLQQNPNDVDALYGMSCCYALQRNIDESLKYLALAINQQPEETKNRAKKDPEFDGIREHLVIYAIA